MQRLQKLAQLAVTKVRPPFCFDNVRQKFPLVQLGSQDWQIGRRKSNDAGTGLKSVKIQWKDHKTRTNCKIFIFFNESLPETREKRFELQM